MKGYALIMIPLLLLSAITFAQQRIKKQLAIQKPKIKVLPPKLYVEAFSGEFAKWVTVMTAESKREFRFKWINRAAGLSHAMAEVRKDGPGGVIIQQRRINHVPNPGKLSIFKLNPFLQAGGYSPTVYVTIRMYKANNQLYGPPSNFVRIKYKKNTQPITQLQLDRLRFLRVNPSPGTHINCPPGSNKTLKSGNSIELTYFYELNTEVSGEVRQWLITKSGSVAANNYWNYSVVQKGKGQVTNRATIFYDNPAQPVVKIYGVKYVLTQNGKELVEKKHMFSRPFFFKSPASTN